MRWLGALWLLPVAVPVWVVYLLPAWAFGWIDLEVMRRRRLVVEFSVVTGTWHDRLWTRELGKGRLWVAAGLSLPFAIIIHHTNAAKIGKTSGAFRRHELTHCTQWLLWGPLFPIAYLVLWIARGYDRHPLEVAARAAELAR